MKRYRITVARLVTHTVTTWAETPKVAMDEARLRVDEATDPATAFPTTYGGSFVNTIVEDAPEPASTGGAE